MSTETRAPAYSKKSVATPKRVEEVRDKKEIENEKPKTIVREESEPEVIKKVVDREETVPTPAPAKKASDMRVTKMAFGARTFPKGKAIEEDVDDDLGPVDSTGGAVKERSKSGSTPNDNNSEAGESFGLDDDIKDEYFGRPRSRDEDRDVRRSYLIEMYATTNIFWLNVGPWWIKYIRQRMVAFFNLNALPEEKIDAFMARYVHEDDIVGHVEMDDLIVDGVRLPLAVGPTAGLHITDYAVTRIVEKDKERARTKLANVPVSFYRMDGSAVNLRRGELPEKVPNTRTKRNDDDELRGATNGDARNGNTYSTSRPLRTDHPRGAGRGVASSRGGRPHYRN